MEMVESCSKVQKTVWDKEKLLKLKTFADDRPKAAQTIGRTFDKWKTVLEKEKNAGYQHFLLVPHRFQKLTSLWVFQTRDCMIED